MDTKVHALETSQNKKINEYIIDETVIKVGSKIIWLWLFIAFA